MRECRNEFHPAQLVDAFVLGLLKTTRDPMLHVMHQLPLSDRHMIIMIPTIALKKDLAACTHVIHEGGCPLIKSVRHKNEAFSPPSSYYHVL